MISGLFALDSVYCAVRLLASMFSCAYRTAPCLLLTQPAKKKKKTTAEVKIKINPKPKIQRTLNLLPTIRTGGGTLPERATKFLSQLVQTILRIKF